MPIERRPISDILVTVDKDFAHKYHARKLTAKLRHMFSHEPLYQFYKEYPTKMFTREQVLADHQAFLINSLLYNN